MTCPFCDLPLQRIVRRSQGCIAFAADAYPVSRGHTLVIPERHVESFFETSAEEKGSLFRLLEWCRHDLLVRCNPAGFNIGINDGKAAGQTVMHLHIHLIPRYTGDKPDPRGGVRWILRAELDRMFSEVRMLHDAETSRHVAAWSYEQVERAGGLVWVGSERFEHLGREWRSRFGTAT